MGPIAKVDDALSGILTCDTIFWRRLDRFQRGAGKLVCFSLGVEVNVVVLERPPQVL
jgi:hypothetical protein